MKITRRRLVKLIKEAFSTTLPAGVSKGNYDKLQISQEAWVDALRQTSDQAYVNKLDMGDLNLMYHSNYDHGGGMFGALIPNRSHYAVGDDPKTLTLAARIQRKMNANKDMKKSDQSSYQSSGENIEQAAYMVGLVQDQMEDESISREEFIKQVGLMTSGMTQDVKAKIFKLVQKNRAS